ncbi:FAD-binding molybdopterin dehydrogenase [Mycobacterium sp. ACS1612]|uniref:FAD binding domain-containing protein n=1 Tax=Mycobacterium sp. ACS1612 TaxID=1834117 RepID=UPI0007FE04F8|nr:xanthine dehydrogenase family protein subunit M [Mycobacterium sp. ACS1612]OBF31530.1 FAD-binding molybdopterin dehydrogenase [Mycobacterium sp. ACS1612]
MFPFSFTKAADESAALAAARRGARYIAGGTTLIDLMRETVERPDAVVDINALPYRDIDLQPTTLRIGSLVRMSELAAHRSVRQQFPVIAQALELSASAQIRNMASIGGNLMQRPRCLYFRDVTAACNRRTPGAGCAAIDGRNRTHAILGTSDACVATHPSDLAVALTALDAAVITRDSNGEKRIPVAEFFRMPGRTPERERSMGAGALITGVEVPVVPEAKRSGYLKVRDRESFEFALASAAVGLDIASGTVRAARVAVGGVGTVPWRLPAVEQALVGRAPSVDLWRDAASHAADGAKPLSENGFKVELVKRTVERQLATVAALP